MINLLYFKSKTKKPPTDIQLPKEIILLENVPMLGDRIPLKLNEQTNHYEGSFKIPITDDKANVMDFNIQYSLHSVFFIMKMVKYSTPEEIDKVSFIEMKKEALRELINKIENL